MGGSGVAELVNAATSENLKEMDWTKSIEICELVARDQGLAKDVIKSIKKRLGKKSPNTQLFAVMLLEMLMNNCGEHIHKQVIDNGLLPILVKIVKKKTDLPVRERIFLLLDATQTALGGASGKFPQYYTAYYDLVSARVQFPQRPNVAPQEQPASNVHEKEIPTQDSLYQKSEADKKNANGQIIPDSSIIHKAISVLDVLMEVLDAVNPQHPEGATDEFVLDLVEQCSFQKQRVMHLIMTSRDEKIVTQAIDLNDRLHKALAKHDTLLSVRATSTVPVTTAREDSEEEDEERLFRRIRKGKACAEDYSGNSSRSFMSIPEEKMKRPLCIQPADSDSKPPVPTSIPPPPAKHMERERFFKEKQTDGSTLSGHMRGLSLHSRNGSSSRGGSSDFSERDAFGFRD
ncbi:ENTH/VHS domain-containing protein [Dioscorea alata]|uniref:ENTH/VHS domain-containing protein n=2 Tax=Dioscorea alata TaxID=55571 RepID=A0ACB7WBE8_DIOAL|nr:ENTH/VHS domain-containing protein [Dioscorea alata]KAH7685253.1 ENTH/VHS domain-containing protein [Dioscorea alata]